jgi:hypothetical protein
MAGLVPAIHVYLALPEAKTWMPGTRPGMTAEQDGRSSCPKVAILPQENPLASIYPTG